MNPLKHSLYSTALALFATCSSKSNDKPLPETPDHPGANVASGAIEFSLNSSEITKIQKSLNLLTNTKKLTCTLMQNSSWEQLRKSTHEMLGGDGTLKSKPIESFASSLRAVQKDILTSTANRRLKTEEASILQEHLSANKDLVAGLEKVASEKQLSASKEHHTRIDNALENFNHSLMSVLSLCKN